MSNDTAVDEFGNELMLPTQSEVSAPFWEMASKGVLVVQKCPDSGRLLFPPRPRSPFGRRAVPEWVSVTGKGTIWSFVVPRPPLTPQFAAVPSYNVIVVALDEDPRVRLVGNLVEGPDAPINSVDPATITIGEPVEVVFGKPLVEGTTLPRWRRVVPVAGTSGPDGT